MGIGIKIKIGIGIHLRFVIIEFYDMFSILHLIFKYFFEFQSTFEPLKRSCPRTQTETKRFVSIAWLNNNSQYTFERRGAHQSQQKTVWRGVNINEKRKKNCLIQGIVKKLFVCALSLTFSLSREIEFGHLSPTSS